MIRVVAESMKNLKKEVEKTISVAKKHKGQYISLIEKATQKKVIDDLLIDYEGIEVKFEDDSRIIYGWDEIENLIVKDRKGIL